MGSGKKVIRQWKTYIDTAKKVPAPFSSGAFYKADCKVGCVNQKTVWESLMWAEKKLKIFFEG